MLPLALEDGDVLLPADEDGEVLLPVADVSLEPLVVPAVPDVEPEPYELLLLEEPFIAFVRVYAPLAPSRHPVRVIVLDDELELLWS